MKVTLSWLKEFVDINCSVQELAHSLTMSGLEVESLDEIARPFQGVLVGKILSCKPHPEAEKLQICQVDAGRGEAFTVVCGAPNAEPGMLAPLAIPSAFLSDGRVVEQRKIRGVVSDGMLCSEAELGLTGRDEGLMELDENAQPGQDLTAWLGAPDYVIDVFITPNRPDCLSVMGLAREIAAATKAALRIPTPVVRTTTPPAKPPIEIELAAPELCPRYSGRFVQSIKIQPSPFWLAYRLHHAGMRSINLIVDITNYVMLECGQPLHAFDAVQIEEKRIVIRAARAGELFTTLDGKEYILEAGTCLICDGNKPVALGGIMGGLNSEVQSTTQAIFLESAYFEPIGIRKSVKRLSLSTESSRRFERGANPNGTRYALDRAVELMQQWTHAQVVGNCVDIYPAVIDPVQIDLPLRSLNQLIGVKLTSDEVAQIFSRLDIACISKEPGLITCIIPTFRPDLTRPVDLIEEVARIYGFDHIPFASSIELDQTQVQNPRVIFNDHLRRILVGFGLHETLSFSLVAPQAAALFLPENASLVELLNPLSAEWSIFRTNLLISLLNNAAYNRNRQMANLRFFEMGNVAWRLGKTFEEKKQIAGMLVGETQGPSWYGKPRVVDFYDIKGIVLGLLESLGNKDFSLGRARGVYWGEESSGLYVKNIYLGSFGRLNSEIIQHFKIKTNDLFAFLLDFELLYDNYSSHRKFKPIPKFPFVPYDIALLVDSDTAVGEIEQAIHEVGGPYLTSVHLFDYYQGRQVPEGKKSIAFSLNFCSKERTLGVEEVERHVQEIIDHLAKRFAAELRPR